MREMINDLPKQLPQIFQQLQTGRHISLTDYDVYNVIRNDFKILKSLFKALGYNLVVHPKEFYYFEQAGKNNPKSSEQMVLFTCLLIDYLDKKETDLENAIVLQDFKVDSLPHFKTDRYKELMAEVGVTNDEKLIAVLVNLEKYGFAKLNGKVSFKFKTPVYRFFDLCLSEINRDKSEVEETGESYE